MSAYGSIEETGAKPGDSVKCVSVDNGLQHRFHAGQIYTVVDFCGRPCIHGSSDFRGSDKSPGWHIPWRGYGAKWEKV